MKQITKAFGLLRGHENLVKEMKSGLSDDTLVAYASVEVTDSVGDVVVIDGIDTSEYHNPPTTHMKILASHMTAAPDGSPPVVGRVERFLKANIDVNGAATPALVFAMSWADTDLATKVRGLMDGGFLDSFSVGLLIDDAEPIKETGGLRYTKSRLYEVSAVAIPANSRANVLRAIKTFGAQLDVQSLLVEQLDHVEDLVAKQSETINTLVVAEDQRNNLIHLIEGLRTAVEVVQMSLTEKFDSQEQRLDGIEAQLVAKSDVPTRTTGDRKSGSLQQVEQIAQAFKQFAGR